MTEIITCAVTLLVCSAVLIPLISKLQKKKNADVEEKLTKKIEELSIMDNELESEKLELEKIAYTEPITGLDNMAKFSLDCKSALDKNPEATYGIIIFEIDNLAKINISYGLEESDKVRCFVADSLRQILKSHYIYGRVHEQLFAIMSYYDEDDELINLTELISENIKDYSANFQVHMSFGIYKIEDNKSNISEMINLAELAKRTINKRSENNYAFYTKDLEARMIQDDEMGKEMNHALEHHQFIMYMQPMVNLRTHEIIGGEALVRWNHPTRGILSPFAFLPLFEANNFIIKLDHYIWDDAFKTIRHWIDNNVKPVPISINISPIHFDHPGFADTLDNLAVKYKIPKNMITLEFPERAFSETTDEIIKVLERLAESGFPICIDNFGSYHSPINLLKNLPVSIIKLDRKFLNNSVSDENGMTILRYLNAMTKELDKSVIAEGVETVEQANKLSEFGCDYAQGFFFSKPLPLREFDEFNKRISSKSYIPPVSYPTFDNAGNDMLP